MRMVSRLCAAILATFLLCGPAVPAFADSAKGMMALYEEVSGRCRELQGQSAGLSPEERKAVNDRIIGKIEQALGRSEAADAPLLCKWGELYVELAENTEEDIAYVFLEKAEPIYMKARERNRREVRVWTGLAEVFHVRAEKLHEAGYAEEARKSAEAGFAVFAEGEKNCPNNNFLNYMWGSNLVLRAYNVENPERRALREAGIDKFTKATAIEPDDQYALRMAGTAYMRIVADLPSNSQERKALLRRAESWYVRAFAVDPKGTCSHLSEARALLKDEKGLRDTLQQCAKKGALPESLAEDEAFDFVREKLWFKQLTEKADNAP